jgi:SAM-dependent MidA family methyltransferase
MSVERSALNTPNGNVALIQLLRDGIERNGPQSFAWFMQQALYHPEHGYYSSGRCAIGRKGDYFTNVSVGPLFGQLLAVQFSEIWGRLGKAKDFVIVEQGAQDGQFARDVLEFTEKHIPEFFAALRYRIVEPFPVLRERQRRNLGSFRNRLEWRDALEPFAGIHFSNELLDAMPVRLINNGIEQFVGLNGDNFVFVAPPVATTASQPSSDKPAVNQAALDWIDEVAANLYTGYVIAIDYGWLDQQHPDAVQIRARHRHLDSPFEEIGQADISMHVDWKSIVRRAEANGLRVAGFTDQHHFFTGIISTPASACRDLMRSLESPKAKRELQTLLHPEMLGRAFQVLALAKNVDPEAPRLAGFKLAHEPCSALELDNSAK